MLRVDKVDKKKNYRMLPHGAAVFHEALKYVLWGQRRFHVCWDNEICYDLYYEDNQQFAEKSPLYPKTGFFTADMPLYPSYYFYDESDIEKICFDMVEGFDEIWFEKASEYNVVITRLLLDNTDKTVCFADERIKWFVEDERIRICGRESCPDALKVYDEFVPSSFDAEYSRMDAMVLFHHMFMFQWLTPLKLSDVKYVEFTIPSTEGIGSIFLAYGRGKAFFTGKYGFTVTLKPGAARYSDSMMRKYCNIAYTPEDSNENNTICIVNYHALMKMRYLRKEAALDNSIFTDSFLHDMKSYAEAVHPGKEDYDDFIEDVTVNYLYAMYILSNCDAFVYSCRCSGAAIVTQLGKDKIKRTICLSDHYVH